MKLNTEQEQIETSLGGFNQFEIKSSAKSFQILSNNLYSNKLKAIAREYITNAIDAHIQANTKAKIEIKIPSKLDTTFNVRDFGPGLSEEHIKDFFCTYFSSSKDQSNDFTGALGLGCKSGFSYTDSFTVTSYYNGIESLYIMSVMDGSPESRATNQGFLCYYLESTIHMNRIAGQKQ